MKNTSEHSNLLLRLWEYEPPYDLWHGIDVNEESGWIIRTLDVRKASKRFRSIANPVAFPATVTRKEREVSCKGLAIPFSRIKDYQDIKAFANEYGLLGLASAQPKNVYSAGPNYGGAGKERLSWWFDHVTVVNLLLRLYRILQQSKKDPFYNESEVYNDLVEVIRFETEKKKERAILYCRNTGHSLRLSLELDIEPPEIAAFTLSVILSRMLKGGIHVGFKHMTPAKDAILGFRIAEQRYTYSPLAAVYHDLWEMVTEDRPVRTCEFCGRVIERYGKRKYCNDACRQAAWRSRQKQK